MDHIYENIRHISEQMYYQQISQQSPEMFMQMLPIPRVPLVMVPPRPTLPGVEAKLDNGLWNKFHEIGTEMIITKCGRRMFPSMCFTLSGLDEKSTYFVLLDMVPIGGCRYKFSDSNWVKAGGAEAQSPQRTIIHQDSPATGAHWQSQAVTFNKVKLTNNTLDDKGQIVLTSMHKYQPCLHIISASDISQLAWAPQKAFVFPETEFIAVTAYQNESLKNLKIDTNPFAKGFRETGQARCSRKTSLPSGKLAPKTENLANSNTFNNDDDHASISSDESLVYQKFLRSEVLSDEDISFGSTSTRSLDGITSDLVERNYSAFYHQHQPLQLFHQEYLSKMDLGDISIYHNHLPVGLPMLMHPSVQHSVHPVAFRSDFRSSAQIHNIPPVPIETTKEAMETSEIPSSSTTRAKPHNFSISAILAD